MSEQPGSDPFGDFQRWLMKAGARSITRDVTDRVKSTMGGGKAKAHTDVWDEATTTDPTDEPPECQWCPICRAARKARDSGGSSTGLGDQIAGAADALAGLTRDAFSLFETAMRNAPTTPPRSAGPPTAKPPTATRPTATPATPATPTWSTATAPTTTPPPATPPPAPPASAPKPASPGPGRPKGSKNKHKAPRQPVGKRNRRYPKRTAKTAAGLNDKSGCTQRSIIFC